VLWKTKYTYIRPPPPNYSLPCVLGAVTHRMLVIVRYKLASAGEEKERTQWHEDKETHLKTFSSFISSLSPSFFLSVFLSFCLRFFIPCLHSWFLPFLTYLRFPFLFDSSVPYLFLLSLIYFIPSVIFFFIPSSFLFSFCFSFCLTCFFKTVWRYWTFCDSRPNWHASRMISFV
jgi:ABC-type multidrug transport system permease subunit